MTNPDVTCILVAYNHAKFIKEALAGAFNQDYPGRIKYVILDDGSTDGTHALIKDIIEGYPQLWIEDMSDGVNRGLVKNLNRGLSVAVGEVVVLLSCDDVPFEHRVRRFVEEFIRDPRLMACTFNVSAIDERGGALPDAKVFDTKSISSECVGFSKWWFNGCNQAYRRSIFDEIGGLSEVPGCAEDVQMILMALLCGRAEIFSEKTLKYRRHAGSWWVNASHRSNNREHWRRLVRCAETDYANARALQEVMGRVDKVEPSLSREVNLWCDRTYELYWTYASYKLWHGGWLSIKSAHRNSRLVHLFIIKFFGFLGFCMYQKMIEVNVKLRKQKQ